MLRCRTLILIVGIALVSAVLAAETKPIVLDLKAASQLALKSNSRLGSAVASVEMAKAGVGKAKSALYPSVGAESSYSYLNKQTIFGNTPILERNTEVNRLGIQQTVFSGGAVQAGVNRAPR